MFTFNHFNFNVFDLERSLKFYDEALGLKPVREKNAAGPCSLPRSGGGSRSFRSCFGHSAGPLQSKSLQGFRYCFPIFATYGLKGLSSPWSVVHLASSTCPSRR